MNHFERTISQDEANASFVFVSGDGLDFFPYPGTQFQFEHGGRTKEGVIQGKSCMCGEVRGVHVHQGFAWNSLAEGDTIIVRRDRKKASRYHLQIRSAVAQRALCG